MMLSQNAERVYMRAGVASCFTRAKNHVCSSCPGVADGMHGMLAALSKRSVRLPPSQFGVQVHRHFLRKHHECSDPAAPLSMRRHCGLYLLNETHSACLPSHHITPW